MTTLEDRLKEIEAHEGLLLEEPYSDEALLMQTATVSRLTVKWLIAALRAEREKRVGADAMLKEIVEGLRAGAKVAKAQEDEAEQKKRALFKCDSQ